MWIRENLKEGLQQYTALCSPLCGVSGVCKISRRMKGVILLPLLPSRIISTSSWAQKNAGFGKVKSAWNDQLPLGEWPFEGHKVLIFWRSLHHSQKKPNLCLYVRLMILFPYLATEGKPYGGINKFWRGVAWLGAVGWGGVWWGQVPIVRFVFTELTYNSRERLLRRIVWCISRWSSN